MNIPQAFAQAMQHHHAGQFGQAAELYRQIISLAPDFVEAHYNLGIALKQLGRVDEAITSYRAAVKLRPTFAQAFLNLGNALKENGELEAAIGAYRSAIAGKPDYAEALHNLASSLHEMGQVHEAIRCFQRALELSPNMGEAYQNLGNALRDVGMVDEAARAHQKAMEFMPGSSQPLVGLGNSLRESGQAKQAIDAYRQALTLAEGQEMSLKARCLMASNLLYTLHFDPEQDCQSIWREHVWWNDKYIRPNIKPLSDHLNDRSKSRKLRIGYVSPDFSQNPVGRFMLPLLANHNHEDFEIFCYSDIRFPDAMTERLRTCADMWRQSSALTDDQLIDLIRADQIDILVDLSLHTRDNRMLVFARKPAPVQMTYLAYCGTTGLSAVDYRLTDSYMDLSERGDEFYAEKSIRLPHCFWCYQPILEQLEVGELPALRNSYVTFGCFNSYSKVNPLTFSHWCRLLGGIPNSRLVLFADPGEHRKRAWEQFEKEGLDPRRLWFSPFLPTEQYLRQYQQIDIALDPFPYGGGTTTFDALWMGVPVVSLAGDTAVSRAGLSILSNFGLPQLVASNWDNYATIAADLANDLQRVSELRSGMRQRMKDSPLMDALRFARDVEACFRRMWQTWLA